MHRIPNQENWPCKSLNKVLSGDSLKVLKSIPDNCISLAVTSPPYWDVIDYEAKGQVGHSSYEQYIDDTLKIWKETCRVLIPNGKLAIVTPIMPISKAVINNQHTRHLKNINNDIEHSILANIEELHRYSLFIWKKQTSVKMFGSYPYPPNIYEDNTVEFINVFVKDGPPPQISKEFKENSKMTQEEWRNLTMQIWPIYPQDVKRAGGHPCPFPTVLPQRLIKMYSFAACRESGFEGDIVLDMFNGTGATCIAAKSTGRNYIGIDLNKEYCKVARYRLRTESVDPDAILLEETTVKKPRNSKQVQISEKLGVSEDKLFQIQSTN